VGHADWPNETATIATWSRPRRHRWGQAPSKASFNAMDRNRACSASADEAGVRARCFPQTKGVQLRASASYGRGNWIKQNPARTFGVVRGIPTSAEDRLARWSTRFARSVLRGTPGPTLPSNPSTVFGSQQDLRSFVAPDTQPVPSDGSASRPPQIAAALDGAPRISGGEPGSGHKRSEQDGRRLAIGAVIQRTGCLYGRQPLGRWGWGDSVEAVCSAPRMASP